jgi:hypothetical protein
MARIGKDFPQPIDYYKDISVFWDRAKKTKKEDRLPGPGSGVKAFIGEWLTNYHAAGDQTV